MKCSQDFADRCSLTERLLDSDQNLNPEPFRKQRWSKLIPWLLPTILSIVLLMAFFVSNRTMNIDDDLKCIKAQSIWSPAIEATIPLRDVKFNGTLDYPSVFRGPPNPTQDAAWQTLVNRDSVGAFGIPSADFRRLNQTLDGNTTRLSDYQGGQFFATLEVFHQLHCLNFIREYTYKEYYESRSPSFTDPPEIVRIHVDHCIEMLRQKLTCDADVGVITYNWVAVRDLPWPNFNVLHKCRNFEGVVEWSKNHNAPYDGVPLKKPSWVKGLENPP